METQQLEALIRKYNAGTCTAEEKQWLEQWYQSFEWNEPKNLSSAELQKLKEEAWRAITTHSKADAMPDIPEIGYPKKIVPIIKWWRYAAAVLIIATGAWIVLKPAPTSKPVIDNTVKRTPVKDVMPGSSKASLTLADGSVVELDSAAVTQLKEEDGTLIDKKYGKLVYNQSSNNSNIPLYNTLNIPRGAEYQLVLPDGSKVWLNAASSLKFPLRFTGNERKVFLTGEAYFEVAKNAAMPFKVITDETMEIEVLGTHFNVNAYEDEATVKTTLAEGKVKIKKGVYTVTLSPEQQAQWKKKAEKLSVIEADVEKEIAWKNGIIEFSEDDLPSIMRQLSRWYNVDVGFEGKIPDGKYNGSIPRRATLAEVMEILKIAGVKYWLENKKVIVTGS